MLRWPVQLRIHLSNVRKFDRIAFYLRTVFLDKVLSAFRVYQQAGNAFFAICCMIDQSQKTIWSYAIGIDFLFKYVDFQIV